MRALILAGGYGTRLRPTTKVVNKHLLPVWNKPLILYTIEALRDAGVTQIILSLSSINPYGFMELLGDGDEYGVQISYTYQHNVKGIAWAINEAAPWLNNEPFIVYLGDNIFTAGIRDVVQAFQRDPSTPLVTLRRVKPREAQRYGVALLDNALEITRFVEKPQKPISDLMIPGLYCLNSSFFHVFSQMQPSARGEYEITDALNLLLPVNYQMYEGPWWDCGTYRDFIASSKYYKTTSERL